MIDHIHFADDQN